MRVNSDFISSDTYLSIAIEWDLNWKPKIYLDIQLIYSNFDNWINFDEMKSSFFVYV